MVPLLYDYYNFEVVTYNFKVFTYYNLKVIYY